MDSRRYGSRCQEGNRKVKETFKNAREFAQWVEENPSTFFRRDSLPETGENEILKPWQICEGLGYNLERKMGT